jgi:hypothetical protein
MGLEDCVTMFLRSRLQIIGVFEGEKFEYRTPDAWPLPDGGLSEDEFWWSEGNMSCDCNRCVFVGFEINDWECSEGRVLIDRIEALDFECEPLILNESSTSDVSDTR